MKKIIFTLLTLTIAGNSFAQAPNFAWAKQSTDASTAQQSKIAVDTINHFVYATSSCAGNINFGSGDLYGDAESPYLVKYDLNGTLIWGKIFPSASDNIASGIAVDNSGNIFVTGYSQDDTIRFGSQYILNSHHGSTDHTVAYLVKFDANGNTLWLRGNTGGGGLGTEAVAVDASGNAYITGYEVDPEGTIGGFPITTGGAFFMKFNSSGTAQWLSESAGDGSALTAISYAIAIDHAGNCVAAGTYASSYADFGSIHVVNGNGLLENWRFVTKLNSSTGAFMWAIGDGIWQSTCANYGVSTDGANNVYLTGQLAVATEGPGSSASESYHFVEKLNSSGVSQWVSQYDLYYITCIPSIVTDNGGSSYVTVSVADTTAYGAYTIIPNAPFGVGTAGVAAVIKINTAGNVVYAKASQNPSVSSFAIPSAIALDNYNNPYITGAIEGTCQFDATTLPAGSDFQFLIAKLGTSTSAGINEIAETDFLIYPNPAHDVLNIQYKSNALITASVVDMMGRVVVSQQLTPLSAQIDISGLAKGIYNIVLLNEKGEKTSQRFVIQ